MPLSPMVKERSMITSFVLLFKFVFDIGRRLVRDSYFRALGTVLLLMTLIGTLFFWLAEGRPFLYALAYSVSTLSMAGRYGWGPKSEVGLIFNIIYVFLGVGLYLLFVLEAGKTMVQSYEDFTRKMAERRAAKQARKT
jgi:voltage-gated potassium channel